MQSAGNCASFFANISCFECLTCKKCEMIIVDVATFSRPVSPIRLLYFVTINEYAEKTKYCLHYSN